MPPEAKGKTGGEGLNEAFRYGGKAGRYSAQVSNAFLGTSPGDLSRLISGASRTFGAFARRDAALQGLIVNFDVFTGALANQSQNLETTIHRFAPALKTTRTSLVNLNRTLPPLRAYAIELTPAVAELPGLISASKPWLAQVRPAISGKEGGGVARLLAKATPGLAEAAQAGKAVALPQLNQIGLCTTKVVVPVGNQTLGGPDSTGGPTYREFFYLWSNFAGQGENFDGNGPYFRLQPGGGSVLVHGANPKGNLTTDQVNWANTVAAPSGVQPQLGGRPAKKDTVPCYKNPAPDLNSGLGEPGPPTLTP
jgi:hypothetical protein